jgi:hypothetical protein
VAFRFASEPFQWSGEVPAFSGRAIGLSGYVAAGVAVCLAVSLTVGMMLTARNTSALPVQRQWPRTHPPLFPGWLTRLNHYYAERMTCYQSAR